MLSMLGAIAREALERSESRQVVLLTMQGKAFKAQKLVMGQYRQPAQAPVSIGSFQAKGKPVSNAEVHSLTHTEAVGEAAMVGTREGDDILTRSLNHSCHTYAWTEQLVREQRCVILCTITSRPT